MPTGRRSASNGRFGPRVQSRPVLEAEDFENERWYLAYCSALLHGLLGWNDERIAQWAAWVFEPFRDGDTLVSLMMFHEPPEYYVTSELMRPFRGSLRDLRDLEKVRIELQGALARAEGWQDYAAGADVDAARKRVERVLRAYDQSLESVRSWHERRAAPTPPPP